MSKRFTFISLALAASVAFLVGIIVAGGVSQTPVVSTAPVHEVVNDRPRPASFSGVVNFADVAERINPSVVNIEAASRSGSRTTSRLPSRSTDDPLDPPRDNDGPASRHRQRLHRRQQRLHPDELPRHRRRRSHHGDARGRARVSRLSRRRRPGHRRRAREDPSRRRTCRPRRSATPTNFAPASGYARSAIPSVTCTR